MISVIKTYSEILCSFPYKITHTHTHTHTYIHIYMHIFIIRGFGLLSSFFLLFPQRFGRYVLQPSSGVCLHWCIVSGPYRMDISCLNFWEEAWWCLSLMVSGLLSSSLLLFPQRFHWYVLQPSSGVCRIREKECNVVCHSCQFLIQSFCFFNLYIYIYI